ncbi:hypothetical protein [Lelliottia wanjuensis]|uniref:hypothetical protein n=1 Tax=Lelliottia wanjuensis TaxID=3050585 RepID=UPI0025504404|nr:MULTISPECIES: hypothetical protein [unclassified Lelliottia]MDK9354806.1 hypothetical protein [Lelliottia sp. V106_16]MDK9372013.1 hypothetical protein [Lelliottia sp. V106_10]MDK9584642.1 hypothetical protein [Lelliottia sp. V86_10]MDK9598650.1 hypothetical protein [Lelliottia sp. V106_5]
MSVREQFFKKVQQKQHAATPGGGSVEDDIRTFCERMAVLARQIQQWFDGTGIEVVITTISLQDLSTVGRSLNSGVSRYDITTIRLQNDIRSVSIQPEQLYQDGCTGCVTLTVDTPDHKPGRKRFYLSMKPEGGWFIREEHQASTMKSTLTEDVFFQAIENLA